MTRTNSLFAVLLLTAATSAAAETAVQSAETNASQSSSEQATSEVCVRNDLDRVIDVSATWGVGDGWSSKLLSAGATMVYRLVADAGGPQNTLTVSYREYFGSVLIAQRQLWSGPASYPTGTCGWGPQYAFVGEDDGHLRTHVVLQPIIYGAAAQD